MELKLVKSEEMYERFAIGVCRLSSRLPNVFVVFLNNPGLIINFHTKPSMETVAQAVGLELLEVPIGTFIPGRRSLFVMQVSLCILDPSLYLVMAEYCFSINFLVKVNQCDNGVKFSHFILHTGF